MAPASLRARGSSKARTSSSEASPPAARTKPARDPPGMLARGLLHQVGPAHRRSADDNAGDALAEPALDGGHVANAAAELHGDRDRFQDALDRGLVDRLAGKRAVEIDHVQVLEPLRLEQMRLPGRVAVKDGRAVHVALLQAHAQAVLEIDGGKEGHCARPAPSPLAGEGWGGGEPKNPAFPAPPPPPPPPPPRARGAPPHPRR